jgi:hypothetical protein
MRSGNGQGDEELGAVGCTGGVQHPHEVEADVVQHTWLELNTLWVEIGLGATASPRAAVMNLCTDADDGVQMDGYVSIS